MGAFEAVLTFLGSSLCHQLDERSFFIDGFQMPLCARCLGLHLAFLVSAAMIMTRRDSRLSGLPPARSMVALGVLMIPAMADVILSYLDVVDSDNTRRVVTGALFGAALAFVLVPFVRSLLAGGPPRGTSMTTVSHLAMLAGAFSVATALALLSESSEPLFYAVAAAGIVGMFATFFGLVLLLTLLLTDERRWAETLRLTVAAAATPLMLVLLALLHGAALD
ncbi:TPA: DUF2085 domain-containing protein [Thermoplasmata archaeon]|nr:DUF2085 domain-containing protein [Thermoplasmata archaeon]